MVSITKHVSTLTRTLERLFPIWFRRIDLQTSISELTETLFRPFV